MHANEHEKAKLVHVLCSVRNTQQNVRRGGDGHREAVACLIAAGVRVHLIRVVPHVVGPHQVEERLDPIVEDQGGAAKGRLCRRRVCA